MSPRIRKRLPQRRTLYELVAESERRRLLIGYAPKTWDGLITTVRRNAGAIVRATAYDTLQRTATHAAATATGWVITFTGRTQRQARSGGELAALGGE